MIRPNIPVRDGLRFPKRFIPTVLTDFGASEYRAGFWLGYVARLCWGAVLAVIVMEALE
jgi:hypothetical protein